MKLLPPYHKEMSSETDCLLANDRIAELERDLDAAREEAERLRCCGNCAHFAAEEYQVCEHPARDPGDLPAYISAPDPCEMEPPCWTARKEA